LNATAAPSPLDDVEPVVYKASTAEVVRRATISSAAGNLALGCPATQSSISPWSNFPSVEADAAGAVNGQIDGRPGFHTQREAFPWWQVDLQGICYLTAIRLYNRQDCADRFRFFTILGSLDGAKWVVLHRREDPSVFGTDLKPYVIQLPPDRVARYVRIQLDRRDFLHFCECEILGARADESAMGALQASFSAKLFDAEKEVRQRLETVRDGRVGTLTMVGENAVFVDAERYSDNMIRDLTGGHYDARERALVADLLRADDRVLEVGTGIGAVTMTAARVVGADAVLTYDGNPSIVADARRNFAFNRLAAIQARAGVLQNRMRFGRSPGKEKFAISRDFRASRLDDGHGGEDVVASLSVPASCLEDQMAAHRASALVCDIEGGEVELLLGAELSKIRLIILRVHDAAVGAHAADAMMRWLVSNGHNLDLHATGQGIAVLRR